MLESLEKKMQDLSDKRYGDSGKMAAFEAGAQAMYDELSKMVGKTNLPNCSAEELRNMLIMAWEVDSDMCREYEELQSKYQRLKEVADNMAGEGYERGNFPFDALVHKYRATIAELEKE